MDETRLYSAGAVVMRCADSDTLICVNRDGSEAARGAWYQDKVLFWLHDERRALFRMRRDEGNRVTVTRA